MRNLQTIQRHIPTIDRIDSYSETTLGMCTTCIVTGLILLLIVPAFNMMLPFTWEGRHNWTTATTSTLPGATHPPTTITTTTFTTTTTIFQGEDITPGMIRRGYMGIPAIVQGTSTLTMLFKAGQQDGAKYAEAKNGGIHAGKGVVVFEEELRKHIVPFSLQDHFNMETSDFRINSITGDSMPGNDGRFIRHAIVVWKMDAPDGGKFVLRMTNASLLEHTFRRQMQNQITFWDSIKELNVTSKAHVEFYGMKAMATRHGNFLKVHEDGSMVRPFGGAEPVRRMVEDIGLDRPVLFEHPNVAAATVTLLAVIYGLARGRPKQGWQP